MPKQNVTQQGAFTAEVASQINGNFSEVYTSSSIASGNPFGTSWFVNGDSGSDTFAGTSSSLSKLTIQAAVTAAVAGDRIYITPRAIAAGGTDPANYAETIIIPAGKSGLQLIGTGGGPAQGAQPQIKKGSGATALLTVRSPGCVITGLSFNGGSSTGGGILLDDDGSTKSAFGTIIAGCFFKNCVGSTATDSRTGGAIQWSAAGGAWQVRILGNRFYKNVGDIVMKGTSGSVPQDVVIQGNVFSGSAASTDCNIVVAADGIAGLVIDSNIFPVLPAIGSGSVVRFYSLATGCTGVISNNNFGSTALTFGGTNTGGGHPATMFLSNNYQQAAVAQAAANGSIIGYTA